MADGRRRGDYPAQKVINGIIPESSDSCSRRDLSTGRRCGPCEDPEPLLRAGRKQQARPACHRSESLQRQQWAAHESSPFFNSSSQSPTPIGSGAVSTFPHFRARRPSLGGSEHARARQLCSRLLCPDTTHLGLSRSATCVRAPGLASGPKRGKAERARLEGGVVEVRAQPATPISLPPPDEERRGKGRSELGRPRTPGASSWRGGAEERGSTATSARGGEGRRKSGPIPTPTDSETPPPPHLPGNSPPPSPAHSLPQP